MSREEWEILVERVVDDIRATPDDRALAERLGEQARTATGLGPRKEATTTLRRLLDEVEARDHRIQRSASGKPPGLAWSKLYQELAQAEKKWGRVANVQFWLGIVTVPAVLLAAGVLVLGFLDVSSAPVSAFLSLVIGAAVTHSFLVLRIHQQARQAEERVVEKRFGLAFLRLALEEYAGSPEFEVIVKAGTQMFLGHHAAPTVPLGPEDLRAGFPSLPKDSDKDSK